MHAGPYLSPARTPSHAATGCGGFHLSSPTGGAPNGIPLNATIPSSLPGTPETSPLAVRTGSLAKREAFLPAASACAAAQSAIKARPIIECFISPPFSLVRADDETDPSPHADDAAPQPDRKNAGQPRRRRWSARIPVRHVAKRDLLEEEHVETHQHEQQHLHA